MKNPTLPVAALLGLLLPAVSASAAELRLQASLEDGGKSLRVAVEGALPKRAIVTLKVTREFSTLTPRAPVTLKEVLLPFEQEGKAEARYEVGPELAVPGRYRVRVSFERTGQYPDVMKTVGETLPEPAEVFFGEDMASKEYLENLLKEQAFLSDSLAFVATYIDKLAEMEALVAQNKDEGVKAWDAWRGEANQGLEKLILHGRAVRERFYPDTYDQFAEAMVFAGLFQMESRKFGAAQGGGGYHGTGTFKDPASYQGRKTLERYEQLFRTETAWCRLLVANALYEASRKELAAAPDRDRWDRRRQAWEDLLGLWASDLAVEEAPKALLQRERLQALATGFRGWWDAEQARLFEPENPLGRESEARRKTLQDLFQETVKGLKGN